MKNLLVLVLWTVCRSALDLDAAPEISGECPTKYVFSASFPWGCSMNMCFLVILPDNCVVQVPAPCGDINANHQILTRPQGASSRQASLRSNSSTACGCGLFAPPLKMLLNQLPTPLLLVSAVLLTAGAGMFSGR